MWEIKYLPQPQKFLGKLDNPTKKRITSYLQELVGERDPESSGAVLSANLAGFRRYRVGDYRVICDIRKNELVVLAIDIGHRSAVYKNR